MQCVTRSLKHTFVNAMCNSCSANRRPMHIRAPCPQIKLDRLFNCVSILFSLSHRSGLKLVLSGNSFSSRNIPNKFAWMWVWIKRKGWLIELLEANGWMKLNNDIRLPKKITITATCYQIITRYDGKKTSSYGLIQSI